ncbi:SusD/RagB family nutrient-binding outer membrane lipoprotein [Pedobacter sp.]|uniref:SusD/RagB family nutrient-binding outer membrane lipoprotein n=1 Tax=Pedobacter sp. TaxID=1411316 RepID=UPI0031E10CCE
MKMKLKTLIVLLVGVGMLAPSCTKDFAEINTNPNNTPNALPQQLLAPALVNTISNNMIRNRNFNNELMQVTVDVNDAEGKVFRYDFRDSWSDYSWNGLYSQLTNFKDLYLTAADPVNDNATYRGISLVCQAWIYSILTDTYGDIPFSESNKSRDEKIYEPKFDAQIDVYKGLFAMLEEANNQFKINKGIVASSDPIYAGNITRWRRFCNSLYLRLLLRVSGKNEVATDVIAKIQQIVSNSSDYPIFTSNDDNAVLKWTGIAPYSSPFITAVRDQDFRVPAIGSFFIDRLRDWEDPRLNIPVYGKNGSNRLGIAPASGQFIGVESGYLPGTGAVRNAYFYSMSQTVSVNSVTYPAQSLQTEPLTGMIMNYAELQFILAEAALKGWVTSATADTYYKNGVRGGITQWLPNWPNGTAVTTVPTSTEVTNALNAYLTFTGMEWDTSLSMNDLMERLHIQKYYAMFLVDYQQWFEYRRTGHPILHKGAGLRNNGVMPARMKYPIYVQSTNPTNYKKAIANQGADLISTNVWWQKP